ncbi:MULTISPECIES: hypothetical protein [Paenibacillus]|uniref:hypothetical protein n=1 Tax=Paenibacillus TaxID=44249 RepID=UPI0022B88F2A|nr:hypothetical protein [Paenibacillus caseinilyticus]MCZ8519844.1 hypothetical protein [Paenibacillus caseinilyticus]
MSRLVYADTTRYEPRGARRLSHEEAYWLQFGLQHMEPGPLRSEYLSQIDGLEVTAACDCGEPTCVTVQFMGGGVQDTTRLVELELRDGRLLLIRHVQGRIAELEVI